jgi:hypothetical protein
MYTIKLSTKFGEVTLDKVIEFIFGRVKFYYLLENDFIGGIDREAIDEAHRQLGVSSKWVSINPKQFKDK